MAKSSGQFHALIQRHAAEAGCQAGRCRGCRPCEVTVAEGECIAGGLIFGAAGGKPGWRRCFMGARLHHRCWRRASYRSDVCPSPLLRTCNPPAAHALAAVRLNTSTRPPARTLPRPQSSQSSRKRRAHGRRHPHRAQQRPSAPPNHSQGPGVLG